MNSSTPPPPGDPRERAAARLAERRSRVRRIRNRTAVGSAAVFVAVFGGLYGQLSAGNDPALAKTTTKSAPQTATPTPTQSDTQSSSSTAAADQTWSSSTPAPVTTSQS
jgi:hypothetical protein